MSISATEILEKKKSIKEEKPVEMEIKVIRLVRDMKSWVCTSCNKEFITAPHQCTCGSIPRWIEKRVPQSDELKRDVFKVKSNFMFEKDICKEGQIVSLVEDDEVTRDLVKRNLLIPRKKQQEGNGK